MARSPLRAAALPRGVRNTMSTIIPRRLCRGAEPDAGSSSRGSLDIAKRAKVLLVFAKLIGVYASRPHVPTRRGSIRRDATRAAIEHPPGRRDRKRLPLHVVGHGQPEYTEQGRCYVGDGGADDGTRA